jgi:hypothetical protein
MFKPKKAKLALALSLVLASAAPAFAQQTSASVAGRVQSAGEPVSGAEVTIMHTESGTVSRATTDANGRYAARGLRVGGPYTITVEKDGKVDIRENVYLLLGETVSVNAELQDAQRLETVQVVGTGYDVFGSDKVGAGTHISNEQIQSFPSVNRNIQDYVRLDPRIAQTDKARNEISVGGQNSRFNAIRVDGISTSDAFGLESNSMPTPRQPISMDAIEAINVNISNYDVTIAGATGAVIDAVTKSGTNEFSGSVYGLYRENDWSGKNANDLRPTLFDYEATYGGTFGGPIIKDTLFFFLNYEKYKGKDLYIGNAGYGPIGSGASNIVQISQAEIDEIIAISRNVYGFDPGTLALPALNTETEEYAAKIDWNINESHRASFRYAKAEQSQANLQGFGNNSLALNTYHYIRDFNFETYTAQLFSDWTSNFSTEAKISYRDYSAVRNPLANLPAIGINLNGRFLNFGTEANTHYNVLETETLNASFIGNLYLGDHQLKFGFDHEDNDIYNLYGPRTFGTYTFQGIENYRNGISSAYRMSYPRDGNIDNMAAVWNLKTTGLFLQDTFYITPNLTATYGVRVDRLSADTPLYNEAASEAFGYRNDASMDGKSLVQPRFGLNYTFDTERQTQLRGGFGLFQGAAASVWLSNPFSNNGLGYTDYNFSQGITSFTPDPYNQPRGTSGATQSVDFLDPELQQPSAWKVNLALDHELPWWGMVASAEAVWTQVRNGIYYQQLNLGAPTATGQDGRLIYWNARGLDPANWNQAGTGSSVGARANRLTSYNDAIIARRTTQGDGEQFTLSLTKPYQNNWFWQVAYTYTDANEVSPLTSSTSSSQLGNAPIFQANEEVSARSSYVIRDRFTGALSYSRNFFGDNKTEFSVFYEGRKGKPYSYTFDNDANGDGRLNDLLYIPAGRGDVMFGSAAEEDAFWAFVNEDAYLSANLGRVAERNAAFAPWVHQFDVRVSQEIPMFFGHKAEIWLDILNVGNLIDKDYGRIEEYSFPLMRGVVEYGGIDPASGRYVYRFNTPDSTNIYDDRGVSRWALQVGFRYKF